VRTLLAAFLLTFMGQCTLTDHGFRISISELDSGQFAQRTTAGLEVARSDRELDALWKLAGMTDAPPDVDFRRQMVVAYFMGGRTSGGYSTKITSVSVDGMQVRVDVQTVSPGDGCGTVDVLTSPVDLVLMTRQEGKAVLGQVESVVTKCR